MSRCDACPVPASVACKGDCAAIGRGEPLAIYLAVARSEGGPGVERMWPGHPIAKAFGPTPPQVDRASLALVSACPHRGPVLPVSRQPECGCAELTECRAGKGKRPGAVTLAECLACVRADRLS